MSALRSLATGSFWREAVITQSSNVSYVHQETRSRRSIGLHMSQCLSEICENRWRCARLSGTSVLPRTAGGRLLKLSRARSALPLARDTPDHIANIIRHEKRAVGAECYPYRSPIGHPLVRREEPGQNIPRRLRRAPVRERHEDDLVAAQRAAVPGAVLPDGHAVRKARKRAGRQPA